MCVRESAFDLNCTTTSAHDAECDVCTQKQMQVNVSRKFRHLSSRTLFLSFFSPLPRSVLSDRPGVPRLPPPGVREHLLRPAALLLGKRRRRQRRRLPVLPSVNRGVLARLLLPGGDGQGRGNRRLRQASTVQRLLVRRSGGKLLATLGFKHTLSLLRRRLPRVRERGVLHL